MTPRVIVLEDDETSRKFITLMLKQRGYEVVSAADPTICPVYATPNQACPHEDACGDFLLTDNRMPNMTGLEFIEAQAQRGCKGIILNKAVMSGTWSAEELEKAQKLGCKIFTKPYRISEIIQWLEEQKQQIPPGRKLTVLTAGPEPGD